MKQIRWLYRMAKPVFSITILKTVHPIKVGTQGYFLRGTLAIRQDEKQLLAEHTPREYLESNPVRHKFHTMRIEAAPRLHPAWLLAILVFIIYGSLVPLDFHPHSLAWAWDQFQHTPMLNLGIESRADWIANGVLYLPAGFLLAERFVGRLRGLALGSALLLSVATLALIAFGVEFTQLFFPPRTVSQNDLLAETIGGGLGVLLALPLSNSIRRIAAFKPAYDTQGATLLLGVYMAAYLAFCLFPFDFLLSAKEISAKLASDQWGLLFATSQHGYGLRTLITLAIEVAAILPFGIFIARNADRRSHPDAGDGRMTQLTLQLIVSGLLLGIGIETLQFFTYSGSSQGISVITRTLGVYIGGLLWVTMGVKMRWPWHESWQPVVQRHCVLLTLLYLLGLAVFTGCFYRPWGSVDTAREALGKLHFLPFYYHYYVSEANALTSLISVALLFAPLGILASFSRYPLLLSTYVPAAAATLIETAKLFSTSTHADPTNILIAVVMARITFLVASRMIPDSPAQPAERDAPRKIDDADRALAPPALPAPNTSVPKLPTGQHLTLLMLAAAGVTYWLVHFPVQPLLLAALLAASAIAVWHKPVAILLIIPAALPILDLAPWSGRFYLDELDALLAITLVTGYARTSASSSPWHPALKWALIFLALSFFFSTLQALLPWSMPDINSFANYFSPFNALRISKGFVWALLFIGLTRRIDSAPNQSFQWFSWGMTLGLAAVVAIMVREKIMFGGLLNFSSDYRATGPFSAIHTGGAYVECYLAVATPFLIYLTISTRRWLLRFAGTALLLASTYALMATVSRNGFAGYAVACGLALLALMAGQDKKFKRFVQIALLAGATLAVAVPLFEGSFVQQRMSQVSNDLDVRTAHWHDGLSIRDSGWLTEIFGMGIGRFPDTHFWRSREPFHPSVHALGSEAGNTFLRIAPGSTLYVEQIVAIEPHQRYRLRFDLRSATSGTTVGIALCEKWMLASSRCAAWNKSQGITRAGIWQPVEQLINSDELGSGRWFSQRPVKLSLFTHGSTVVDIDNIHLIPEHGTDRITNADFSHGMDHWYFATDEHLAWHIKSMPLAILFDQGWFGVLGFGLFFGVTLSLAGRAAWRGNHAAGVSLAATAGFLVVGLFDTLIDAPRFLFLLLVLALFAAQITRSPSPGASDKLRAHHGPD